MELKNYLKIIASNIVFIIACTVIASLLAYLLGNKTQQGYKLDQALFLTNASTPVSLSGEQNQYGNYYYQESARNFTDTAVSILGDPSFTSQLSNGSTITAEKAAPQLITVTVVSQNPSESKFILERLVLEFNQKLAAINPSAGLQVIPLGSSPGPVLDSLDTRIFIAAGALLGLALSLFLVSIKTYFKL